MEDRNKIWLATGIVVAILGMAILAGVVVRTMG